jgi:lysine 2,3-aminomutase
MLNQSVLLKGVNDTVETLDELCRELVYRLGVKPYYLHHGDLVAGMEHRRTTIAEGQRLVSELRARLSGICNPNYVIDLPDGGGKVPLHPSHVEEHTGADWRFTGLDGTPRLYREIAGD